MLLIMQLSFPLFRESGFVENLKLLACKFGRAQNFKCKWWH